MTESLQQYPPNIHPRALISFSETLTTSGSSDGLRFDIGCDSDYMKLSEPPALYGSWVTRSCKVSEILFHLHHTCYSAVLSMQIHSHTHTHYKNNQRRISHTRLEGSEHKEHVVPRPTETHVWNVSFSSHESVKMESDREVRRALYCLWEQERGLTHKLWKRMTL